MVVKVAVVAACLALVCVGPSSAADGGSATYTSTGRTYEFNLFNGGTASWQYFILVGPSGTRFVGGTTGNEGSARCIAGQPDGQADEIECGPVSANVIPPSGHLGFVATLSAFPDCGAPFELYVSSTGTPPFSRVGDATFAGSCTAVLPGAVTAPRLHGVPTAGRLLTATPPTWSAAPTRVTYQWQLCIHTGCTPIKMATGLRLKLTKRMAGHTVSIVATATFDGQKVTSSSKAIAIRR
jgi:hypothetical protein